MQIKTIAIFALVLCLAAALAGCTGSSGTGTAAPAGGNGGSASTTQDNLRTSPTDALPSQNQISISVKEKDHFTKNIPIFFDGGMGQIHVQKIEVTVYRADGQIKTGTIAPNKGDSIEIPGTSQTDRVVVYVSFDNGDRMKTNDELVQYRSRS